MNENKKKTLLLVVIFALIVLTFYFQVSGLLGLNRDGVNYFVGVLQELRPSFYDDARRYSHYFSQIFFVTAYYAGISDLYILAQIFSANLFILPVLPFLFFLWKSKKHENLIGIPLLFLVYFHNFNSLNVISESVFAGSLFLVLCGMIHFLDNKQPIWEKVLLFFLMCVTFRVYSSFIFFLPVLSIQLYRKQDSEFKWYFFALFTLLTASLIFNIYTTVTYQFSGVPLGSLIPEYIRLTQFGERFYFPAGLAIFSLVPGLSYSFHNTENVKIKTFISVIVTLLMLILIYLAIQYVPHFRWAYLNKLSNVYFPLFLSFFFFLPDRKFLSGNLMLSFIALNLVLASFLSSNFKTRMTIYYKDLEIKCSQSIGLDTSNPDDSKGQFISEYFSLVPDSILACAFSSKPVKTFSFLPGKSHQIFMNVYKPSTYPDLSHFGVRYDVKNIEPRNE